MRKVYKLQCQPTRNRNHLKLGMNFMVVLPHDRVCLKANGEEKVLGKDYSVFALFKLEQDAINFIRMKEQPK